MNTAIRIVCLVAIVATGLLAAPAVSTAATLNTVSFDEDSFLAFGVGPQGSLSPRPGSPFPILGAGSMHGVVITPNGRNAYVGSWTTIAVRGFSLRPDGTSIGPSKPYLSSSTPEASAVTPDGTKLYVLNPNANEFGAWTIDADGLLDKVPGAEFPTGNNPRDIVISPNGKFAYIVSADDDNVRAYAINADATLSELPNSPFATNSSPRAAGITPDGRFLYTAGAGQFRSFSIAADGQLAVVQAAVPNGGGAVSGIAITPDGRHVYGAASGVERVYSYNVAADGTLSDAPGGAFDADLGLPTSPVATPDGRTLFVSNGTTDEVVSLNIASDGSLSQNPGSPFSNGAGRTGAHSSSVTPEQTPAAAFSAAPALPGSPTAFDGGASSDPYGAITRYDWDFGDGTTLADGGPSPQHAYAAPGTYQVKLTVRNTCDPTAVFNGGVVYTGHTALCNGAPTSALVKAVDVPAPPAPPSPPAPPAPQPPAMTADVDGSSATVDAEGNLVLKIRCGSTGDARCSGAISIKTAKKVTVPGDRVPRIVRIAYQRFTDVPANKVRSIRVKLTAKGRKILRALRTLKTKVRTSVSNPFGGPSPRRSEKTVRFTLKQQRR